MSSVIVSGIADTTTKEQLVIHFQKKRNEGGDVNLVIYPINSFLMGTAIINFAKKDTAGAVVLLDEHWLNGHKLTVRKNYRIFDRCTATFDKEDLNQVMKIRSQAEFIDLIKCNFPHVTITECEYDIEISGSWNHLDQVKGFISCLLYDQDLLKAAEPENTTMNMVLSNQLMIFVVVMLLYYVLSSLSKGTK